MAGSEEQNPSLSTQELCKLIEDVGRHPIERVHSTILLMTTRTIIGKVKKYIINLQLHI